MKNSLQRFKIEKCIARIKERDDEIHALITPTLEDAERKARQQKKNGSSRWPLHGVPYTLKDIWDTKGVRTTGGSYRHIHRVPEESGHVHRALEGAGAVMLGKSNLSDLALSMESDNYIVGPVLNPHDVRRTAGGSSGGAAAAVADGMAAFDWGSDMGGSIRLPAAFCGVVGLRLSHTQWDPTGHFPFVPDVFATLNGMGPIASTIDDVRTLIRVLAPKLRTGKPKSFEITGAAVYAPDKLSYGKWAGFKSEITPKLRDMVPEIKLNHGLPAPSYIEYLYNLYMATHFDAFLEGDEMTLKEGVPAVLSSMTVGPLIGDKRFHKGAASILALFALGKSLLGWRGEHYAQKVENVRERMKKLWDDGFVVVSPVTTYPAPKYGHAFRTPNLMPFCKIGNLTDATGLAVPYGEFSNGMPRSLQFLGPAGSEDALLDFAEKLITAFPAQN